MIKSNGHLDAASACLVNLNPALSMLAEVTGTINGGYK